MAVHHQGALAMYSVSLSKMSNVVGWHAKQGVPLTEQSILLSDGCPSPLIGSAIRFYSATCQTSGSTQRCAKQGAMAG